jgi:hypothetical protein
MTISTNRIVSTAVDKPGRRPDGFDRLSGGQRFRHCPIHPGSNRERTAFHSSETAMRLGLYFGVDAEPAKKTKDDVKAARGAGH